jgi:pimeloyl-ACP methyl ester carboxylesterase
MRSVNPKKVKKIDQEDDGMNSKRMGNRALLVALVSGSFLLSACGSDSKDTPAAHVQEPAVAVSSSAYSNPTLQPLTAYSAIVRYKMPSVNNSTVEANTVVLVPKGTKPAGGWPIIVWAHGTTGVADSCAPSQKADLAGAETGTDTNKLISALLQKGYAVVAPDYEGLGVAGIHPYLNLKSEAYSIIYALKAAREVVGGTSKNWMVVGHSQGGQAALGAAQYASVAKLNFKGTVAVAPASQFLAILAGGGAKADALIAEAKTEQDPLIAQKKVEAAITILASQNAYAALAAASVKAIDSNFNYSEIFAAQSAPIAAAAESICAPTLGMAFGKEIQDYYIANVANPASVEKLSNFPGLKATFSQVAEVSQFLQNAEPGTVKLSQPVLLIQGDQDMTVPVQATLGLQAKMAALGSDVSYLNVDNASHTGALDQSVNEIVNFVSQRFAAP